MVIIISIENSFAAYLCGNWFFGGEFFDESKIQKSSIYLKIVVTL